MHSLLTALRFISRKLIQGHRIWRSGLVSAIMLVIAYVIIGSEICCASPCPLTVGDHISGVSSVRLPDNNSLTFWLSRSGKLSIYRSSNSTWDCIAQYPTTDGPLVALSVILLSNNSTFWALAIAENGALWLYSSANGNTVRYGQPTSTELFCDLDVILLPYDHFQAFVIARTGELWYYYEFDDRWVLLWEGYSELRAGSPTAQLGEEHVDLHVSPNPLRGFTRLNLSTDAGAPYAVKVYSIEGRLVRTISEGVGPADGLSLYWDGQNTDGRQVPNGTYFVVGSTGGRRIVSKAVIID